jgi:L-fuculose-phosphate aldolase
LESSLSLKQNLVEFCRLAYDRKLVAGVGGNISVRAPEKGLFFVTPSGLSLRDMTEESILVVDEDARKLEGPEASVPSMETRMHMVFYRTRPQTQAIVHLHPVHCVALANLDVNMNASSVSVEALFGAIGVVEPHPAGSQSLADDIAMKLCDLSSDCHTFFLKRHGVISCGESIREAFYRVDMAEEMASMLFLTKLGESLFKAGD